MCRIALLGKDTQLQYSFQEACAQAMEPITLYRAATVRQLQEQVDAAQPPDIILLDVGGGFSPQSIGACKKAYPASILTALVSNLEFGLLKTYLDRGADGLLKCDHPATYLLPYITTALNKGGVPLCPDTARVLVDRIRGRKQNIHKRTG